MPTYYLLNPDFFTAHMHLNNYLVFLYFRSCKSYRRFAWCCNYTGRKGKRDIWHTIECDNGLWVLMYVYFSETEPAWKQICTKYDSNQTFISSQAYNNNNNIIIAYIFFLNTMKKYYMNLKHTKWMSAWFSSHIIANLIDECPSLFFPNL